MRARKIGFLAFALSTVGRDIGLGRGVALLSTNKSSVCSEDALSVRVVPPHALLGSEQEDKPL